MPASNLLTSLTVLLVLIGLTLLETGATRQSEFFDSKSPSSRKKHYLRTLYVTARKNILVVLVASFAFSLIGVRFLFPEGNWLIPGRLGVARSHPILSGGDYFHFAGPLLTHIFIAQLLSISLTDRIRLRTHLILSFITCAGLYPIVASWSQASGGALYTKNFHDPLGLIVFSTAASGYALAGILIFGPRLGTYRYATYDDLKNDPQTPRRRVQPTPILSPVSIFAGTILLVFSLPLHLTLLIGSSTTDLSLSVSFLSLISASGLAASIGFLLTRRILRLCRLDSHAPTLSVGMLSAVVAALTLLFASAEWTWILLGAGGAAMTSVLLFLGKKYFLGIDDPTGMIAILFVTGILVTFLIPLLLPEPFLAKPFLAKPFLAKPSLAEPFLAEPLTTPREVRGLPPISMLEQLVGYLFCALGSFIPALTCWTMVATIFDPPLFYRR